MNWKNKWLVICFLILVNYQNSFSVDKLSGYVYYKEYGNRIPINEVQINISGKIIGTYTDEDGFFTLEVENPLHSCEIILSKFNFIPKVLQYNFISNNALDIELMPNYVYYILPPLSGKPPKSDSSFIVGYVYDKYNSPQEGVLVRLLDTPYFAITNESGYFKISLTIDEVTLSPRKEFAIFLDKPGIEIKIFRFSKKEMIEEFNKSRNNYNCGQITIEKYISPSDLEENISEIISEIYGSNQIELNTPIDTAILSRHNFRIAELQIEIESIKDTIETLKAGISIEKYEKDQTLFVELISKLKQIDSMYYLTIKNVESTIKLNNQSLENYNEIILSIINSLQNLGVDISSTRKDLNKQIEENISKFNENARILNESYLKRSRQYDTTAFQAFIAFPFILGPRYPEFVGTFPIGQVGLNTNYGLGFLKRSNIYNSLTVNFLSHPNKDKNYYHITENDSVYVSKISPIYLTYSINFRPPVDFIPNLKIDPGFGFSVGYDYKKLKVEERDDYNPNFWSFQPYIQVVLQYKIFTPNKDFSDYSDNNFMINMDSAMSASTRDSIDAYNKLQAQKIIRKHTRQNIFHNLYFYVVFNDRFVFNDNKYQYGLASLVGGIKFDISSYINNRRTFKDNVLDSKYRYDNRYEKFRQRKEKRSK